MPFVVSGQGKLTSLKIEYNLTEHCNYGCEECSHFSPYLPRRESALATFTRDLEALAAVLRVYRFRFVGGEPLLHREILGHVEAVRASGIAGEIQVCTNGALLDRVPEEVLAAIDSLSVSWYPDPRCDAAKIERARAVCARVGTRMGVRRIASFRTMQAARPIEEPGLVEDIFKTCLIAHRWYCQTFYEGRFYLCSRPLFTGPYLAKLGVPAPDFRAMDGIPIHAPRLKERLAAALRREEPLAACRYCLGTVGRERPWRQLPAAERKAPLPPARPPAELVDRRRLRQARAWRHIAPRALLLLLPRALVARALPYLSPSL